MKTAKEFYDYLKKNRFNKGNGKWYALRDFKLIEDALQPDEYGLVCFMAIHGTKSMLFNSRYFAHVVTNRRFIAARAKTFSEDLKSIQLDFVNDISLKSGLTKGTLMIDTMKETFTLTLLSDEAKAVSAALHQAVAEARAPQAQPVMAAATAQSQAPQMSSADELMQYKQLLDAGVISKKEFNEKKKQILKGK